jgi:GntP family gluconate:H+ symporter
MPIVFMALGSIATMAAWPGFGGEFFRFLGTPIIALGVGVLFALWQMSAAGKLNKFTEVTNETLRVVGPILFVTAAGGVLGRVITETSIVPYIRDNASGISTLGIFFPFLLAVLLKTAQGSGTVSLVTTSSIIAPMLGVLGFNTPLGAAMCVMAVAAGAGTVSHANDSYFWVVTNFSGMTPEQGYRTQTMGTLVQGLCAITGVFILSLILL